MRVDLTTLVEKLSPVTKVIVEDAASVCMGHQHAEVTVQHVLYASLENPLSDVRIALKYFKIDHNAIKQQIGETFPLEKIELNTYPSFSPLFASLLEDAWLLSSAEIGLTTIRSGSIFLATLLRCKRYFTAEQIKSFGSINREDFKNNFHQILTESSESEKMGAVATPSQSINSQQSIGALEKYTSDITQKAKDKELDPVFCRENEISLMIDILCRRRKNNPIVVGDPGVGKSAIIEGFAQRIIEKNVPEYLQKVRILTLDLGLLQAGASVKGEFERRLKDIIDAVKNAPEPIILFIDEAHTLIGAGNQEGGGDAANLLKPALARGELRTIAATTWKDYKKYFEKDATLTRRFQLIQLDEPSPETTVHILRGLQNIYEKAHNVLITDEALQSAATLSARYLSGRLLPDKAIDVLDTACTRIAINMHSLPQAVVEISNNCFQRQLEIKALKRNIRLGKEVDKEYLQELEETELSDNKQKDELLADWEKQKALVKKIIKIRQSLLSDDNEVDVDSLQQELMDLEKERDVITTNLNLINSEVDSRQIATVIKDWTGVPVEQMKKDELTVITQLPEILGRSLKGQDIAIEHIHRNLLTSRADLRKSGRPKGSFLLVGPSGVGKTETVVQLAEKLYGGKQFLTTINMSEYQEKHTVSRLIGSPPGYVGFGEGGILTEAIRKTPYSIVLLDEVEKAHPEVLNIFYQVFDKGELADGEGRLIDCKNILFFLTSNLGYETIVKHAGAPESLVELLYPELSDFFKPALLARMEVVPYLPLSIDTLRKIVNVKLNNLKTLLSSRHDAVVVFDDTVREEICKRTTNNENGARMLEAIIDGQVLPPLALRLLRKIAIEEQINRIQVKYENDEFVGMVS